jgi:hypothetical protein
MIDQPPQNKMMTDAPAKKEFHFAATAEHYAEVVYAATIREAEALYHKTKRPIAPVMPAPASKTISTPAPASEKEDVE